MSAANQAPETETLKVAVPTDDGETISHHFGQAKYFRVISVENNAIRASELREKASHQHSDHSHPAGAHPGQLMVAAISDCQVLISGGMGAPAFSRASAAGLQVILTPVASIEAAVQAYLAGTLDSHLNLIHAH
jgi:predicted Fe-Mo cluster-binding NifX family protein